MTTKNARARESKFLLSSIFDEMALRNTLTHITELVFPVSKEHVERQKLRLLRSGHEYVSNLPLQIALYCNACYFPFWAITNAIAIAIKYPYINNLYITANLAVFVAFSVVEIIRLIVAYSGNLREKMPELAGSWMLTLIIQTPIILFMLFYEQLTITPPERAVNAIMAVLIIIEDVMMYFAVQVMNTYQLAKFHFKQFHDLERENQGFESEDLDVGLGGDVIAELPREVASSRSGVASARRESLTKRSTAENPSMNLERID